MREVVKGVPRRVQVTASTLGIEARLDERRLGCVHELGRVGLIRDGQGRAAHVRLAQVAQGAVREDDGGVPIPDAHLTRDSRGKREDGGGRVDLEHRLDTRGEARARRLHVAGHVGRSIIEVDAIDHGIDRLDAHVGRVDVADSQGADLGKLGLL